MTILALTISHLLTAIVGGWVALKLDEYLLRKWWEKTHGKKAA